MLCAQIDLDGNGFISAGELGYALEVVGFKLAQYEVRNLLHEFDTRIKDEQLDMKEFSEVSSPPFCVTSHVTL